MLVPPFAWAGLVITVTVSLPDVNLYIVVPFVAPPKFGMFTWVKPFFFDSWLLYHAETLSVESLVHIAVDCLLRWPEGTDPLARPGVLPCGVLP